MKTAAILHGVCDEDEYFKMDFPSPSNAHWLPWLQQKFLRNGVLCQSLEMPKPYAPVYEDWSLHFDRLSLSETSTVVGHSAGCGFILKWLQHNPAVSLDKLVLVAPWLDPFKRLGDFLACELKPAMQDRIGQIHVLYSTDEPVQGIAETKDMIFDIYPKTKLHLFHNKKHFCFSHLKSDRFEELWDICK